MEQTCLCSVSLRFHSGFSRHFLSDHILKAICQLGSPGFHVTDHIPLTNHTAHACEGDLLVIKCPSRTSVAVLSAFYGRRVPYKHLCPAPNTNITAEEEDTDCTSSTALEFQVSALCLDERSCHIPVLAPVFGPDPCPLTTKYLLVSYKCKPGTSNYCVLD
uniref:Si:ch73-335m24.2 n=1 Tax=Xiphophorus maculatus TaxID=8083 RepID=A0A3B5QFQ0_XIPMA